MSPTSLLRRPIVWPRRHITLAAAGLLVLAVVPFRDAVFGGAVLFRRDIGMVWLPMVESFVRVVAEGSWPLWDPHRAFGQPLLADPRAEVLYPLTWLNLVMSPGSYYTFFVVLHVFFSSLGLFALARRWGASVTGALVAASAWGLSGPFLSLSLMWHHLAGAAWLPWLFLATEGVIERPGRRPVIGLALAIAAQVFAGSPDYTALGGLMLAGYAVTRLDFWSIEWRSPSGPRAFRLVSAAVWGLAIAAGQWLPTLDFARRAERWHQSAAQASTWSLHPLALPEIVAPFRWSDLPLTQHWVHRVLGDREPWLPSVYLGVTVLGLALVGALSRLHPRRWFLALSALVATLFSLGKFTPVYGVIVSLVPPLGMLRFPVKAMPLVAFALALLAGSGVDTLLQRQGGARRSPLLWTPLLLTAVGIAALWVMVTHPWLWSRALLGHDPIPPSALEGLRPLVSRVAAAALCSIVLAALCLFDSRMPRSALRVGLVALPVLDLLAAHGALVPTAPADILGFRPKALQFVKVGRFPRIYGYDYSLLTPGQRAVEPTPYRLARVPVGVSRGDALGLGAQMSLAPPTAARWGLDGSFDADILGFYTPGLARLVDLLRTSEAGPRHLMLLRMGAVTSVVALRAASWQESLEPVATIPGFFVEPIRVFRVPDPLPRAFAVGRARSLDLSSSLDALRDPDFDPAAEVLLPLGAATSSSDQFTSSVRIVEKRANEIEIQARLSDPGYVVDVESFDPGWRASVDGEAAPLLCANLAFRAVPVPAGLHRVRLLYRPEFVMVGLGLTAVSLAAAWVALLSRSREA